MSSLIYAIITLSPLFAAGAYKMFIAFDLLRKYDITLEESKNHKQYQSKVKHADRYILISIIFMLLMFIFKIVLD